VGRELTFRFPERTHEPGEVLVEVRNLTSADANSFVDVSFDVRRGEVLGIGGLVGAQRTELVESLFGLRRVADGEVRIAGRRIDLRSPRDAKRAGMALLTEDRRASGIFPTRSVLENTTIAALGSLNRWPGIVDAKAARQRSVNYSS